VQVINAPGRFDRSPELLAHDVARWATTDSTSVVCVTEVADDDRAAALAVEGWTTNRFDGGSKGETAILTKDAVRKVIHRRLLLLNNGGGKGRLSKSLYAPSVVTEAPSGRRTLVTACHLRAHIEGIWAHLPMKSRTRVKRLRKSGKAEIRAYIADVDAWRHQVHHLAAEYHVDDILVVADWNLSSGSKWVRDLMTELWPGLHMVTTKQPDLGHRTVGWVLTSMDGGQASKVYKAKASDHDAGWFTLTHVNAPHPNPKPPKPPRPPDPFQKVTYNGALMDQKTKTAVQLGEKRLGYALTILQGCYHPGVSQSAGTHDGGQVIDFAPFDWETKVRVFRMMGWFIWHRLPIPGVWGEHIHGGIRNGGTLSPSAARQQVDFDAHPPRNGLADHAVDTSGIHPDPPATFSYLGAWHEIND
jgi:hypothetical protein